MSESSFRSRFRKAALREWRKVISFVDPSQRGAPDTFMLKGPPPRIVFVEYKDEDGTDEVGQPEYQKMLRDMGFEVAVIRKGDQSIDEWLERL